MTPADPSPDAREIRWHYWPEEVPTEPWRSRVGESVCAMLWYTPGDPDGSLRYATVPMQRGG